MICAHDKNCPGLPRSRATGSALRGVGTKTCFCYPPPKVCSNASTFFLGSGCARRKRRRQAPRLQAAHARFFRRFRLLRHTHTPTLPMPPPYLRGSMPLQVHVAIYMFEGEGAEAERIFRICLDPYDWTTSGFWVSFWIGLTGSIGGISKKSPRTNRTRHLF